MDEISRLEAELAHKSEQLAAVREISRAIAEAWDLDTTLDLITQRTAEVMKVDSCSIYLYDKSGEKLVLKASTGLRKEGIDQVYLPHGTGLTGWAAEHRQAVVSLDASKDPRFHRIVGSGESRFATLMAMPLISRGNVIGAANVQTAPQHEFGEDEIELFSFITDLAATALDKAQLVHAAVVQEMHHRVKNNLQTMAMLLRLQIDQADELQPKDILRETINRVLSIAVVHEILAEEENTRVGLKESIERVAQAITANMTLPGALTIKVSGDEVELGSQPATGLALVANELIQNALEHSLIGLEDGRLDVELAINGDVLNITVTDNGPGLPPEFDPALEGGLGLDIVRTLVTEDLKGTFTLAGSAGHGTRAQVAVSLKELSLRE